MPEVFEEPEVSEELATAEDAAGEHAAGEDVDAEDVAVEETADDAVEVEVAAEDAEADTDAGAEDATDAAHDGADADAEQIDASAEEAVEIDPAEVAAAAVAPEEIRRAIEALILVADTPVSVSMLAQLTEVSAASVVKVCEELAAEYVADNRGFVLVNVAGGYRFQTHTDVAPYIERFALEGQSSRLSAAALETLAIIAYKQPLSRAQVAAIRGVNADAVMRTLHHRGYIDEIPREDGQSLAVLFRTTDMFLERIGLSAIEELPALGEFAPGAEIVEALEQSLSAEPVDPELVPSSTSEEAGKEEAGKEVPDSSGPDMPAAGLSIVADPAPEGTSEAAEEAEAESVTDETAEFEEIVAPDDEAQAEDESAEDAGQESIDERLDAVVIDLRDSARSDLD